MRRSFVLAVMAIAIFAVPTLAQTAPASPASNALEQTGVALNPPVPVRADAAPLQGSGLKTRVGRMVTGAVVGGWLGYFASQVAASDWDAATNASVGKNRGTWAAAGVLSGALLGRLVNPGAARAGESIDMTRGRSLLTREQIVGSGATTAQQLIRAMRPEWMQPRGVNSFSEIARGSGSGAGADASLTVVPGEDHILVYVDNARVGGTQNLADLPLADVQQIEFVEGPQATFRWGAGHAHGVILITTMDATGR